MPRESAWEASNVDAGLVGSYMSTSKTANNAAAPAVIPRVLKNTLDLHKGSVNVVRYAKGAAKYILSGGQDRKIRLWNRESGAEIKAYSGHGWEVLCVDVCV